MEEGKLNAAPTNTLSLSAVIAFTFQEPRENRAEK